MADVSAAFVHQYEGEVHIAYQQGGSLLRNTVRVKDKIVGASTTFTKLGKGEAKTKARSQDVDLMNLDHAQVKAILEDYYAADMVDKLDEYKINHDERAALAQGGGYAVGRKIDGLIIKAASAVPAAQQIGTATALLNKTLCLEAFAMLNEAEVPDDGNRFAVVGPRQWNALLEIDQFAKASYVGDTALPWLKGREAKKWLNIIWMMHSGLEKPAAGVTKCLMYHKSALGLAEGTKGIESEINYVPTKVAYLCNSMISAGVVVIDSAGVVAFQAKDK